MRLPVFLTARGRLGRLAFWLRVILALAVFSAVLAVTGVTLTELARALPFWREVVFSLSFVVAALAALGALVVLVLAGIRRLHDRNRSGWWLLLFWAVPNWLNGVVGNTYAGAPDTLLEMAYAGVAAILSVWGIVELGVLSGTKGPNRFGASPVLKP